MVPSRTYSFSRIAVLALALTVALTVAGTQAQWRGGGWRGGGGGWGGGGWGWGGSFGVIFPPLYLPSPITTRLLHIIYHRHTTRRVLHSDIPPTAPAEQRSTSNHMASQVTAV
jgi:hypothetical protein